VIDAHLQDNLAGIRSGRFLNLKALGLIYRISLQAATIQEAFFYLNDYMSTTFPILKLDTQISGSDVSIYLKIENNRNRLNWFILENFLTVMEREIRMMAGESIRLELFSPSYTTEFPEHWTFNSNFGLRFQASILPASLKDKNRLHLDLLIPEYLKLIESFKAVGTITDKVKIAALNLSDPELPGLDVVADSLNITPRTLQRRLQKENSGYRQISDELKKKISEMLLLHNRFSVADISHMMGYSETSAYIHAFNKWYGIPPQKFREEVL
jgi:AraC-like DNA-binding protein